MKTTKLKLKIFYLDRFRKSLALKMTDNHELMEKFSYNYTDSFYSDFLSEAKPEEIMEELNKLISKVFFAYYEIVGEWMTFVRNNEDIVKHVLESISAQEYTLTKVKDGEFIVEYPEEIYFDETLDSYGYNAAYIYNDIIYNHISKLDKKVEYKLGEKTFEIKLDWENEEGDLETYIIMRAENAE